MTLFYSSDYSLYTMTTLPSIFLRGRFTAIVLLFACMTTAAFAQSQRDGYQQTGEGLTVFGEVFRHIQSAYMDRIESDELLKVAIDAMTKHLDPYSVYYPEEERDDLNVIYDGSYTGLGMNAVKFQGAYTVVRVYPGFAAEKAGLLIGDRITHVNNRDLADSALTLKDVLDGNEGDSLDLTIVRALRDTIQTTAMLEQIQTRAVPFYTVLDGGVGYIQLARFTRQSQREFRQALHQLYRTESLNGLIIDIRDNRGGLLHAAAGISELFLPKGNVIVSTKGRLSNNNAEYRSRLDPMYPQLPLAVLINENSASASEILASALQDNNRATILGKQSFGKGLVQNVLAVPYGGQLKLTTARYYTPNGRLLQKVDYKALREKSPNSEERTEPEDWRAGVTPDIETRSMTETELTEELYRLGLFEMYVGSGVKQHELDSVPLFASFVVSTQFALRESALEKTYELQRMSSEQVQVHLDKVVLTLQEELYTQICSQPDLIQRALQTSYALYTLPFQEAMKAKTALDDAIITANKHLLTTASAVEE